MAFREGLYPQNLVLDRHGLLIKAEVRKGSEGKKGRKEGGNRKEKEGTRNLVCSGRKK